MKRKEVLTGITIGVLTLSGAYAADGTVANVLEAGTYTAKVAAIPCEACPPVIEKTFKAQPGIDQVSVDQKTSSLTFTVKPGAQVQLPDLQSALKAASDQMGMGADYQLHDIT